MRQYCLFGGLDIFILKPWRNDDTQMQAIWVTSSNTDSQCFPMGFSLQKKSQKMAWMHQVAFQHLFRQQLPLCCSSCRVLLPCVAARVVEVRPVHPLHPVHPSHLLLLPQEETLSSRPPWSRPDLSQLPFTQPHFSEKKNWAWIIFPGTGFAATVAAGAQSPAPHSAQTQFFQRRSSLFSSATDQLWCQGKNIEFEGEDLIKIVKYSNTASRSVTTL